MSEIQEVIAGAQAGQDQGFLTQICAYFRDFLDTDFRRQRLPKRSIDFKDARGNLTGVSISKYPALVNDLWTALGKPLGMAGKLQLSVTRGRYRSRIRANLLEVIEKYVATLEGEKLEDLADRMKANAREYLPKLKSDPDRYQSAVLQSLRNEFVRAAIGPLLVQLDAFFERNSADAFETAYNVEDELSNCLIEDVQSPICSALATAIVENRFDEFDAVIADAADAETVGRRIVAYFEAFSTSDFFDELHELRSTLKLRENFEVYLYIGELKHGKVSFPLFYLPLEIALENAIFRVSADPHLYINKRALDYAAQETARELSKPVPLLVDERIKFLPEGGTFTSLMQELLDRWTLDLALRPPLDLSNPKGQKAQRSQMSITNGVYFSAFDKSDEALLNDYEELLTVLADGTDAARDFSDIVMGFLRKDPLGIGFDIEKEWDGTSIPNRLVFQSPVPLNEEQRKILAALRHSDSRFIAIEGPPGTGKSHTITAMVFQAILNGQNVLVLSDKVEALDVVENKLAKVLNEVRFGDDFQNPILRLGKSGNSYGKILSSQSIEAIRAHHRATSSAAGRLAQQLKHGEETLAGGIQQTISRCADITMQEIAEVSAEEAAIAELIPGTDALIYDDAALELLDCVRELSALLSQDDAAFLHVLERATGSAGLRELEVLLSTQRPLSAVMPDAAGLTSIKFFAKFSHEDLQKLQKFIFQYKALQWPLFGFLFTGGRARELDFAFGRELNPVTPLNVHRHLATLERAFDTFSRLSVKLSGAGISTDWQKVAFQQLVDGVPPRDKDSVLHIQHVGKIRHILSARPDLATGLGIDTSDLALWTDQSGSGQAHRLSKLAAFAAKAKVLKDKFRAIPTIDYAGDKSRLETLHAQRLAHMIDGRVVEFAENHRNLSRSIRDIISKRQRFPKEQFEALKKAFPCMIAGIRDYAEYVPLEQGLFDLVIIDEASQVSIAQAFPAFVRAKKLVVLGDQKQFSNVKTSNASIEINTQYVNNLLESFRRQENVDADILNRVKLFDIKTSVLKFVERIANYQTMLRKHFRGYPELISFSSKTFYGSQLQAVKIRGKAIDEVLQFTAVEPGEKRELRKNINLEEFAAIVAELRRLAEFDEAPSVGIITPFNEQQAYIVQRLTAEPDGEDLQDKLDIKVMTFDSCQGEERDIIMYSMVATPDRDKLAYIFPRSLDEADEVDHVLRQQRLNVGFSRAKERIHIFHSQPLDQFKNSIGRALNHFARELEHGHTRPGVDLTRPSIAHGARSPQLAESNEIRARARRSSGDRSTIRAWSLSKAARPELPASRL